MTHHTGTHQSQNLRSHLKNLEIKLMNQQSQPHPQSGNDFKTPHSHTRTMQSLLLSPCVVPGSKKPPTTATQNHHPATLAAPATQAVGNAPSMSPLLDPISKFQPKKSQVLSNVIEAEDKPPESTTLSQLTSSSTVGHHQRSFTPQLDGRMYL